MVLDCAIPDPQPCLPSDIPSAPLLLAVEDVSDSSVTVSWEPPETLGRLGIRGYVLELCRVGGEPAESAGVAGVSRTPRLCS